MGSMGSWATAGASALSMMRRDAPVWRPRVLLGGAADAVPPGTGAADADAERFLLEYRRLVEAEVARYARRGGDRDDLAGEAWLALWEARQGYRPTQHRTDLAHYVQNHVHRRVRAAYVAEVRRRYRHAWAEARDAADDDGHFADVETRIDWTAAWHALRPQDRVVLADWLASRRDPAAPRASAAVKKRRQRARARLRHTVEALPTPARRR
ncbi:MAG: sigma factor [Thermaerobacter sp.]|nr:sigma factor [Thermaerobacter sp.]